MTYSEEQQEIENFLESPLQEDRRVTIRGRHKHFWLIMSYWVAGFAIVVGVVFGVYGVSTLRHINDTANAVQATAKDHNKELSEILTLAEDIHTLQTVSQQERLQIDADLNQICKAMPGCVLVPANVSGCGNWNRQSRCFFGT